jgi:hypothetical protein
MSSPGSATVRIDLPSWLAVDLPGCAVWLALAVALEHVAAPALGQAPGLLAMATVIGGGLATAAAHRRHRLLAVILDERRIAGIVTTDGRPVTVTATDASRVMGRTVLLCGQTAVGGRIRLWIMPYDAPQGSLRRLALALRRHAGSREA